MNATDAGGPQTSGGGPHVEVVPAILRQIFEGIKQDWEKIVNAPLHIQIDVTDGIFAGEGTFRELRRFKQLPMSEKIELHLMVHTPENFLDDVVDLSPARCVFHVESFSGTASLEMVYARLREATKTELGLAINPDSPNAWLEENLGLVDYVMFMGYNPGWANQPINTRVFKKIAAFRERHPDTPVAVDGHVNKETIEPYVRAGVTMLCANTSIFGEGDPVENYRQLTILAEAAAEHF